MVNPFAFHRLTSLLISGVPKDWIGVRSELIYKIVNEYHESVTILWRVCVIELERFCAVSASQCNIAVTVIHQSLLSL